MNTQELERVVEREEVNRFIRRKVRNLAEALACISEIPEGRQIVSIVGNGDERSNVEALQTWVAFELKHCGLCESNELDYLYARLLMVLGDYRS